jgi:multimeric flavodoxin WrbA
MPAPALKVLAFNCSLKSAGGREKSSTDVLLQQLLDALAKHGAKGDIIRAVDHDIKPGVKSDEGEGDAWPVLRKRVVEADIVVIGTPIWLGQPSSVAKRVLERMDAFLSETDARGRMPSYGKVALAVVVGNEDGAHHTAAELFQALTEVGLPFRPAA